MKKKPEIGDKVWILIGGKRFQRTIIAMHPEDSDACYVDSSYYVGGKSLKSYQRFDELYYTEGDAIQAERRWSGRYDDYVDPNRKYH